MLFCHINILDFFVRLSQVQLLQLLVDGVNLLIEMEKRLEKGKKINDLIPAEAR